jgi:Cu2+-exporting ATPase
LGLATFLGWLFIGAPWQTALTYAIAVLIITCPCALALAVPAVQIAAASRLFRRRVIVKAADGLERIAEADMVVFDKTGTLTLGRPELLDDEQVSDSVLANAASLAAASRHPYARAMVEAAEKRLGRVVPRSGIEETPGLGLARPSRRGKKGLARRSGAGSTAAERRARFGTGKAWSRRRAFVSTTA